MPPGSAEPGLDPLPLLPPRRGEAAAPEQGQEHAEELAQRGGLCEGDNSCCGEQQVQVPVQVGEGPAQRSLPPGSPCRCGCVTMLKSPNKTTAVKQWEQRWIKNCLCGGLWRRMPLSCP